MNNNVDLFIFLFSQSIHIIIFVICALMNICYRLFTSPFSHRPSYISFTSPKFCITIVSNFLWVLQSPQEKSKTVVMQNLGGGGVHKVHYGLCENVEFGKLCLKTHQYFRKQCVNTAFLTKHSCSFFKHILF